MGPIIGFCIGVFDCFHYGHLRLIQRASDRCCHLIVAVVKDAAVKAQKGDNRPVIPFEQRIEIVRGLSATGEAIASESFDPYEAVTSSIALHGKVDKFFKGEDQAHIPTDRLAKELGVEIVMLDRTPDVSTTKIIERMK